MRLIGQAHTLVHQGGVARVQTDVRVGTRCVLSLHDMIAPRLEKAIGSRYELTDMDVRTDKEQSFKDKVLAVERILGDGKG